MQGCLLCLLALHDLPRGQQARPPADRMAVVPRPGRDDSLVDREEVSRVSLGPTWYATSSSLGPDGLGSGEGGVKEERELTIIVTSTPATNAIRVTRRSPATSPATKATTWMDAKVSQGRHTRSGLVRTDC